MPVDPSELDEVISVTTAMRPNCRSSGVATDDAIVSGLAPGSEAETEIVGKSTCGSGDTGSNSKATAPASPTAIIRSVVAIGRRMNGAEMFTTDRSLTAQPASADGGSAPRRSNQIDDRRGIERQQLADEQSPTIAMPSGRRVPNRFRTERSDFAEERRQRSHHDRPKTQQARFADGLARRLVLLALGFEREVDRS
jgi:hypothetical protein